MEEYIGGAEGSGSDHGCEGHKIIGNQVLVVTLHTQQLVLYLLIYIPFFCGSVLCTWLSKSVLNNGTTQPPFVIISIRQSISSSMQG